MQLSEYRGYDGLGLARLVRDGEVTPAELLDTALTAIAARSELNAFVCVVEDQARQAIAYGLPSGPFAGVPFAVKDLWTDVAGCPSTQGSALFASGELADHDTELVRRYRAAGFVITAKTTTPEFGLSATTESALHGPTHNPWRTGFSPGGSSGGAAAAVAAGLFPLAHATDGGGSIRIPSALCGLFGLKPTRARMSFAPDRGDSWAGMSSAHVVSRTVRDSAAALDATQGACPGDPYVAPPASDSYLADAARDPQPLRIGLALDTPTGADVDPAVQEAARATALRCEALGHVVVPVQWPVEPEQVAPVAGTITCAETAATVDARLAELGRAQRDGDLEPMTALLVEAGRGISAARYIAAVQGMHAVGRRMAGLFREIDVLITPAIGRAALPHGVLDGNDPEGFVRAVGPMNAYAGIVNMTGQPAMSLPLDVTADGMPLGTQVIGRFGAEDLLISLAGQLERAHPWAGRTAF